MKRLTEANGHGDYFYTECAKRCNGEPGDCAGCDFSDDICFRLGQYEDAGMTPEQIKNFRCTADIADRMGKAEAEVDYLRSMTRNLEAENEKLRAQLSIVHLIFGGNYNV